MTHKDTRTHGASNSHRNRQNDLRATRSKPRVTRELQSAEVFSARSFKRSCRESRCGTDVDRHIDKRGLDGRTDLHLGHTVPRRKKFNAVEYHGKAGFESGWLPGISRTVTKLLFKRMRRSVSSSR